MSSPASAPPKKPAPKKPKPSTAIMKPRTPLEAAGVEIEHQASRLERRKAYIKGLAQVLPQLQRVQKEEPDLIDLLLSSLSAQRPNAPPDGAAQKAALELVTTKICDRLDEAYSLGRFKEISREGLAELFGEWSGIDTVTAFAGDFYDLLHVIDPVNYPVAQPKPRPTLTAPQSPARVEEYARRREAGEELHVEGDVNDLTDTVIVQRLNGMGDRVLGRKSEMEEPDLTDEGP